MSVISVRLRVAGPLLFRAPGEFTPTARGPQAFARSLPLPTPSTIAGCLATAAGRRPAGQVTSWASAVEEVLNLGERGYLRGPYLIADDRIYVGFGDKVVDVDSLKSLERVDLLEELTKGQSLDSLLSSLLHAQDVKKVQRVGTGLTATKAVDREHGLMYLAEMVDYESTFETSEVSIAVDAHHIDLSGAAERIVRLGGEGKVTRIELATEEETTLWKRVERSLKRLSKSVYLCLITFAFLETPSKELELLARGAWLWPSFIRPVKKLVQESVAGCVRVEYVVGEVMLLGAGFDLLRGVRKPCYIALKPGTVIKVRVERGEPANVIRDLYERGLSMHGGRLGYGTFIPVRAKEVA